MFKDNAYADHNIWEHSAIVRDLYRKRARDEAEEMTCAKQAIELLRPYTNEGETIADAGCGSGYFFHSVRRSSLKLDYYGFDATADLIKIGQEELPAFGLPENHLKTMRLEDFSGCFDHVVCMNVLSNLDNYHRYLERLLQSCEKTLVMRESIGEKSSYQYVRDVYLDDDVNLKVHVNTYAKEDVQAFVESYGFEVDWEVDERTQGKPELVIDYPHYWTFMVARRR